jgi:hypothetical protein
MNRSGIGIGSASVALVFAVLCLTVFALISYTAAANDKALTDVEAGLVKSYYEADAKAEHILAESLAPGAVSGVIRGVEVKKQWDTDLSAETVEFACVVSAGKELHVKAAFYGDSYDILSWRMRNAGAWVIDEGLPVWTGN